LIDSWAWIEYFKGSEAGARAREIIEDDEESIVSTINLAEVYRWILKFYGEEVADEKVDVIKKRCFVIDVDPEIAIASAKIKHEMRFGLGDAIVLATARRENAKVVTGDPDFKNLEGVIWLG
jgi:predicted nucleic acid-binding protein